MARLIALRKASGLSQRDLAERLGQPQSYVAKVELHERRLDIVQLIEWLRGLEADEEAFFQRTIKEVPRTKRRR